MPKMIIGNDFIEETLVESSDTNWWVQRLFWFAEDGDVVVLPEDPDRAFVSYTCGLLGVDEESLTLLVAPPGPGGTAGALTGQRMTAPAFIAEVAAAAREARVDQVFPLWPDVSVATLAGRVGLRGALPGFSFIAQSGAVLSVSKASFRAVAAGMGLPLPDGSVCTTPEAAASVAADLLGRHDTVIVKHDWMSGGRGNEILSRVGGIHPIGAPRVVTVTGGHDLLEYFGERWPWLSSDGRARPVVEHYLPDSTPVYAEYDVRDGGVEFRCDGELLLAPLSAGQVQPLQGVEPDLRERLRSGSGRLAEALRAMGYRGNVSPDAIITPERELFFTEWNGRVTGSTHIHHGIGGRVVGPSFGTDRVVVERLWPSGWAVSSFTDARDRLAAAGAAYDPTTRTGIVLATPFDGRTGLIYCVVAASVDDALRIDARLRPVFASTP